MTGVSQDVVNPLRQFAIIPSIAKKKIILETFHERQADWATQRAESSGGQPHREVVETLDQTGFYVA